MEPQLSISKSGVMKWGSTIINPDDLDLVDVNYLKWLEVNQLQQNHPGHTIWLVGDLIHAHSPYGEYRMGWRDAPILDEIFGMNIQNLSILADHLNTVKQFKFHMGAFMLDDDRCEVNPSRHDCGTVACAIGHGPWAGLPVENDRSWFDYSERVFGISNWAWNWCFAADWRGVDNTPAGAAKRILHLIKHGLPDDFFSQMRGRSPYIFAKESA